MADKLPDKARQLNKAYFALIGAATGGAEPGDGKVAYGDITVAAGLRSRPGQNVRSLLDPLAAYCASHGFPDLTAIAVYADTRLPAEGHYDPATWPEIVAAVHAFPWLDYAPPTAGELTAIGAGQ